MAAYKKEWVATMGIKVALEDVTTIVMSLKGGEINHREPNHGTK